MQVWVRDEEGSQPEESIPTLASVEEQLGFLPNLFVALGASPVALEAFAGLNAVFERSGLTPEQQQVVLIASSDENGCGYCVAGHSLFARDLGVSDCVIDAVRSGGSIEDLRLEALQDLARRLVQTRGSLGPADLVAFYGAGFDQRQALEVVLGVVLKTFSNYVAKMLDLPVDPEFQSGATSAIEGVAS